MFRNFVKPAAYENSSPREAHGEGGERFPESPSISGHVTVGDRQPQAFTTEGKTSSHSTSKDMKILQTKPQSKGAHSTSIYVNGTATKPNSSANKSVHFDNYQQHDNKQQKGMQQHGTLSINNSTQQSNVQSYSEVQTRISGNAFDEQMRLANGLTGVQIRTSSSVLDEHKRHSSDSLSEQQQRSDYPGDVQRQQASGPNYEQKRLSFDSLSEQKRVYNSYTLNEEPKRLSSGPVDAQKRLSSDPADIQKRQSDRPNDEKNRIYNSLHGEKHRLSSSSFTEKSRPYRGPDDGTQRLHTGPSSEQKLPYNGADDGQKRQYSSPNDVQRRASGGSISLALPQRQDQQNNYFAVTGDKLQSTTVISTGGQQLTPASTTNVKSGNFAQPGAKEISGPSHEAGTVLDVHRRGLYYQSQYNVVPPPPPLFESAFAGLRDIRNPSSIHEKQIVSVKGTVRGFKNRVRAGIATFWAQSEDKIFHQSSTDQPKSARNYRQLEHGRIVIYGTSMSVVRETSERCRSVRRLLQNHMVRYEERDLYMSREYQQELRQRLVSEGISTIHLPHVFADGIHIGGAGELEKLNEAGELRGLLDHYQKVVVRFMCEKCGGYRFLPCEVCHGSKRSLLRNHFTEEFCALRCMHCDENGLRRCDRCADQQE